MKTPSRKADLQFVFLICSERSGSNLISQILGGHSKIKAAAPYHFARDVILNLHLSGGARSGPGWDLLREQILHMVGSLKSPAEVAALAAWLDANPDAPAGELARFVYADLDPKPGATTIFIKENNLHRALFFVLSCFPDAKFVFQARDPRDYLASAKARRERWLGNKFGSVRNALTVWREDQLGGLALLGLLGSERVFFQRYEDLVSRPDAVLAPLCTFLGLRFEPAMLDFHAGNETARLSKTSGARANLAKPLMASNFGKYRQSLSKGEIRTVETWLGDLMDRFGYVRDFPKPARPGGPSVFIPQITEIFERLGNGERMPFYSGGQKNFAARLRTVTTPVATPYPAAVEPEAP